jgi:hypothetical protein
MLLSFLNSGADSDSSGWGGNGIVGVVSFAFAG